MSSVCLCFYAVLLVVFVFLPKYVVFYFECFCDGVHILVSLCWGLLYNHQLLIALIVALLSCNAINT